MASLNILYSYPLHLGRAGIGETALRQAEGLIALGHRVWVWCGVAERPPAGAAGLVETLRLGPVTAPFERMTARRAAIAHDWRVAAGLMGMKLRGRASPGVDVVHAWPGGALRTIGAARRLGVPVVLERPNCETGWACAAVARECARLGVAVPRWHSHFDDPRRARREGPEHRLATRLACPSEFVRRSFLERGFAAERLALTRYGYDPARFTPGDQGGRDAAREGLRVAFVGSVEPRKGLHVALEAWCGSRASERGRLRVVGRMFPGYERALRPWLDHPSVEREGFTADVPAVLRASDALVLPSFEEGSALVTYEAMASGCVPLVSAATGARCDDGVEGLVHAVGDVAALRGHFDALAADDALRRRLREAALRRAAGLTWLDAARRLSEVYGGVTRGRGGATAWTAGATRPAVRAGAGWLRPGVRGARGGAAASAGPRSPAAGGRS